MKMNMKIRSHRYDLNRTKSKHGHKYSKYKKCLSMMMLICIKQHLSNIWNLIHVKVKQQKVLNSGPRMILLTYFKHNTNFP